MSTIPIGVDLAKSVLSVCEVEASGRVIRRQDLGRDAFALWLAQLPAVTAVAMEACSGAHHWARRCIEHGLQPRLMAAQFVTPFRKSRTSSIGARRPITEMQSDIRCTRIALTKATARPARSDAHPTHARTYRQRTRPQTIRPTLRHRRAGVRQCAPQQAPEPLHPARKEESRWAMEAVRPGPQHREAGELPKGGMRNGARGV